MRLVWAIENLGNNFENFIFVDESITRTLEIPLYQWRLPGSQSIMQNPIKTNIRAKVNVFAAISWRGASDFVTYSNNLNSDGYCEIINNCMIPFISEKYDFNCVYHQDNAPCHKSRQSLNTLIENGVIFQPAPPHSPDFNPIEPMWADMKCFIAKKFCTSTEDVVNAIGDYSKHLTVEKCRNFISNLNKASSCFI